MRLSRSLSPRRFGVHMSRVAFAARADGVPKMFGNAGREHMAKYGTTAEHFAKIAEKNHRHSVNNPKSQFRNEYTLEQIMASPLVLATLLELEPNRCQHFYVTLCASAGTCKGACAADEAPVLPDFGRSCRRTRVQRRFPHSS